MEKRVHLAQCLRRVDVHSESRSEMRYLLMICFEESAAEGAQPDLTSESMSWVEKMDAHGVRKLGAALRPVTDATSVRVREGKVLLADGPFAETKEVVGGFDLIECADLDEALRVAAQHPVARVGTIEVRPLVDG
jgi:hypothetical protein